MWLSSALSLVAALLLAPLAAAQDQTDNLTPDGYWHNRYHSLLSMAAYGDYNYTCPNQTFTTASELKNFPNATRPPWTVINTFGPTASGCSGFTAIVPEMNKALITFRGNPELEQNLSTEVVTWDEAGIENHGCKTCTVNKFAAQGYMECKNETNNWEAIIGAYAGQGLVFSITGHRLGGMHSLIASIDLNTQNISYYSHNQGTPRTFNQAGANYYNYYFDGEAGERAIAGNDLYTESIPASTNYSHAGTPFYYWGLNKTTSGMNWEICWDGASNDGPIVDDPACMPTPQTGSTAEEDAYFYFTPVGQCGGPYYQEDATSLGLIDAWLNTTAQQEVVASSLSVASVAYASSASVASVASVSSASVSLAEAISASEISVQEARSATAVSTAATASATVKTSGGSRLAGLASLRGGLVAAALLAVSIFV